MRKRRLGRTGLFVSEVSLGGVAFWWLSPEDSVGLLEYCLDSGVNHLDLYMGSGSKIGKTLRKRRKEFTLSTRGEPDKIDEVLAEFQVDYIDLFQITMVDHEDHYRACLEKMPLVEKAKKAGKIGFFGIGTHSPALFGKVIGDAIVDTILLPFNYIEDEILSGALDKAVKNDIGILVMKPLAGGNISWATPALKWILQYPVASAVVGMASINEAREDISVGEESIELTDKERQFLEAEKNRLGETFCRMCGHCIYPDPCPEGIEIRLVMMARTLALQTRRQTLSDELLDRIQKCRECGLCVERCPWHLPIPELLPGYVHEYRQLIKEIETGKYLRPVGGPAPIAGVRPHGVADRSRQPRKIF